MEYNSARIILEQIEERIDVQDISYKGKAIWPIVKYYLFFGLLKWQPSIGNATTRPYESYNPGFLLKVKNHFKNIESLVSNYFNERAELKKLKSKKLENSILFLDVTDAEYVDELEGKKYSRYISPYYEFLNKGNNVFFLNVGEGKSRYSKFHEPFYFNSIYRLSNTRILNNYKRKFKRNDSVISNFSILKDELAQQDYKEIISEKSLIEELDLINVYECLWDEILDILKPSVIFLECYYGNHNYAGLLAASKKRNIKSVDIQHGISADQMYMGWAKTPTGGYDLLPDHYWCWSKYDMDSISNSRKGSNALSPLLGGNMWLRKQLNEAIGNPGNDQIESITKNGNFKKTILVTLQHSIPVSDILIEAIKNSDKNWLWLVKFHPLDFVDPEYRNTYKILLKDCINVEYNYTTSANLYFLLGKVNVHITHHSTSSVEAISLKVPTILLGKKFEAIFKKFIDTKNFYIANTANEILDLVKQNVEINESTFEYFKIETSESVAGNLLKKILN